MGAPCGTSQVPAVPATRPGWEVLPFLSHRHAGAPSSRALSKRRAHRFCPEAGGGLETTTDRTLTHNLASRRLSGFDMLQEKPPQPFSQPRGTANTPGWVSLLPQLPKKH